MLDLLPRELCRLICDKILIQDAYNFNFLREINCTLSDRIKELYPHIGQAKIWRDSLILLDEYLQPLYWDTPHRMVSTQSKTWSVTIAELNNLVCHSWSDEGNNRLRDRLLDVLSGYTVLNLSQAGDKLNLEATFRELIEQAHHREVGDVFLYPNSARIVGSNPDDTYGRKHGNYGTGGGWLISVNIWIINPKCNN